MDTMSFRHLWPHVSFRRSDSELEIFTKYYAVLDQNMVRQCMIDADNKNIKSETVAKNYRVSGNMSYKDLSYKKALNYYNLSITQAPRDSVEFGLALGNRSVVFFDLEMYKECLLDIQTLLTTEYPEHLLHKVFMRQAKCFIQLHFHCKAITALKNAQTSFDSSKAHLDQVQIDGITKKLADIKTRIEENIRNDDQIANVANEDKLSLPALKDGENPAFLSASKAVDLKYNERLGRHVVANKKISMGDVLFVEKPYSCSRPGISNESKIMECCSYCFKQLDCFIPCTTCSVHLYCSDSCRQQSWDCQHKWICPGEQKDLLNHEMILALHVLFRASHANFNTSIPDAAGYGNKDDNYPFVNQLLTDKENVSMDILVECIKNAAWIVVYLTHFTDYFDWLHAQPGRPEGSREELPRLVGGMLVKYLLQVVCNSDYVIACRTHVTMSGGKCSFTMKYGGDAMVLCVSTAMLNHSCVSNAAKSFYGNVKVIKAIKDIPKGTEITVTYFVRKVPVSDGMPSSHTAEMGEVSFACECERCSPVVSLQQKLNHAWLCGRCQGRVLRSPNEPGYGKCHDCHHKVSLDAYKRQDRHLKKLNLIYDVTRSVNDLELILKIMKRTLHKHNERFLSVYGRLTVAYEEQGNSEKFITMAREVDVLMKHLNGPTSFEFAMHHATLCLVIAQNCNKLKMQNSPTRGKMMEQCNEICKESVAVLQYYLAQQDLDEYERAVQEILA